MEIQMKMAIWYLVSMVFLLTPQVHADDDVPSRCTLVSKLLQHDGFCLKPKVCNSPNWHYLGGHLPLCAHETEKHSCCQYMNQTLTLEQVISVRRALFPTAEVCQRSMAQDIFIVVDLSDNQGTFYDKQTLKKAKAIMRTLIHNLNFDGGHTQVGIIEYTDTATIQSSLTQNNTELGMIEVVDGLSLSGKSASKPEVAFDVLLNQGFTSTADRQNAENVVILFARTPNGTDATLLTQQISVSQQKASLLYLVKMKDDVGTLEGSFASGDSVYRLHDLDFTGNVLAEKVCGAVPTEEPPKPVSSTDCFMYDLFIAVDNSNNVSASDLTSIKTILKDFVAEATIGENKLRIGIIEANGNNILSCLNVAYDKDAIKGFIEQINPTTQTFCMEDVLEKLHDVGFDSVCGTRFDNMNRLIFVTAGNVCNLGQANHVYQTLVHQKPKQFKMMTVLVGDRNDNKVRILPENKCEVQFDSTLGGSQLYSTFCSSSCSR